MSTISNAASFRLFRIPCTHVATAAAFLPGRVLPTMIPIFSISFFSFSRLVCLIRRFTHLQFQTAPPLAYQCLADWEDDSAEGAALYEVTQSHLCGEVRDRNARGTYVIDAVRYQKEIFLPYRKPLTVGSILKNAIRPSEHHT